MTFMSNNSARTERVLNQPDPMDQRIIVQAIVRIPIGIVRSGRNREESLILNEFSLLAFSTRTKTSNLAEFRRA